MPSETFHNLPDDKRRRIVDAALTEFADHPYRAASVNRIVRAAGISKGSLYQYFDDKYDLFHWLLTVEVANRKLRYLTPPPDHAADLYAQLGDAVRGGLRFGVEHPRIWRIGVRLMDLTVEPELRPMMAEIRRMGHEWLVSLLTDARARGEVGGHLDLSLTARLLARVLNVGVVDMLLHQVGGDLATFVDHPDLPERVDVDALVDGTLAFVRHGLQGPR